MKIKAENFEKEVLNSKIPVLVEFWGSWCLPCQVMDVVLKQLEKEYQDKIKIIKINADMNPRLSSKYDIKGLPTFILFDHNREIKRERGAKSKNELYNLIKTSLAKK